jgi:hypothetical protein
MGTSEGIDGESLLRGYKAHKEVRGRLYGRENCYTRHSSLMALSRETVVEGVVKAHIEEAE